MTAQFEEQAHPRGKGGKFASKSGVTKITKHNERAFKGQVEKTKSNPNKLETGNTGEDIALSYMRDHLGVKDADFLNGYQNNFPIDIHGDHMLVEVKTGLVSNNTSAQQWRATIGQPGKAEAAWLKTASKEEKTAHNQAKAQAILDRKAAAAKQVQKDLGLKGEMKKQTFAVILHPDKRSADLYKFDGFHLRIGWHSDQAKKGYVGSFKY